MIVDVAVPFRVAGSFHYEATPEIASQIGIGSVIEVPFRNRSTVGFVLGFPETTTVDSSRLKTIQSVVADAPLFDDSMLGFLRWVSEYYCHPLGEVIAAAIPRHSWQKRATRTSKRSAASTASPDQTDLLSGSIPEQLTEEQSIAIAKILDPNEVRPCLLHGVTGSGKTEVYIRCLQSFAEKGLGAIVLVPEISLTPLLVARFSARFPGQVAVWHSHLSPRERQREWDRVQKGDARIVIGARSAVFAPVKNLGCIIVDEEHETSFKQEDELRYHARDMAIVRASRTGARVILGSATPSVESYFHTTTGKFSYARLSRRVQERPMPVVKLVDLKLESERIVEIPWLSRSLDLALKRVLSQKQQAILYLNRLGFAHLLYCGDCGHSWRCINCDIGLTYYRSPRALRCHYCGMRKAVPPQCSECQGVHIQTIGFGTEQVERTLRERFPQAQIARMDRSAVTTKKELEALLERIARRDVDIVIGTQMIAKGHDFPGITLVGILNADANLNIPDFRAYERTFQMLTQVAGRAGRAEDRGEVLVQTVLPEHPILSTIFTKPSEEFYQTELELRRKHRFPPFCRLALVRFQHKNSARVSDFAQVCVRELLAEFTHHKIQCSVLGPSEAPLAKLRNYYRWHCLIKSGSVGELKRALGAVSAITQRRKTSVQVTFDIDPINAM